ncbi:MAG: hypothetical protein HQK66_03380 [Desulfamplus sp.]|nr:hypothetical protein [Desulfamplus sp.]
MNLKEDRIMRLKENIEKTIQRLMDVPGEHGSVSLDNAVKLCRKCLASVPAVDSPVYVHITGTDKSFKTSYLMDLFDHDDLRDLFSLKMNNTSENTAVPCLVEPSDVTRMTIHKRSINTREIVAGDISRDEFGKLYDLSLGAFPGDYLLHVLLPWDETPMNLPVIEYPGIKEGADAAESQKRLHEIFQDNLIQCLGKFPGILVACFQHKVAVPQGHPMDIILKKYGEILKTTYSSHKLPLVISLQGAGAVTGYCGNTNVEKDIAADFKSYRSFDTTIQLINPFNRIYPVTFGQPGPHVSSWIRHLSRYKDVHEIRYNIELDGGITWSRNLLGDICKNSHIQDALDNIFLKPWMTEADAALAAAHECLDEIESYDEVSEIREKMRVAIINGRYRDIRTIFKNEIAIRTDGAVENHERFWTGIFFQYLVQFFDGDDKRCTVISRILWDNLVKRLDEEEKNFIGARESDIPYIIMNIAALYVPNALMRGDGDIFGTKYNGTPKGQEE